MSRGEVFEKYGYKVGEQAPNGHMPLVLWASLAMKSGKPHEGQNGGLSPISKGNVSGRDVIS